LSKSDVSQKGVKWVSDGSGEYEVSSADNIGFNRGTKITLKLKPECREFTRELEIEKILKKYSLFITYPIKLNGKLSIVFKLYGIEIREKLLRMNMKGSLST
jgi:HSP90 family molecular chaperone